MSEVASRVLTKGMRVGVMGWERDRLQNGGRLRLKSRHKIIGLCWLLSGAKSTEKCLASIIRPSTNKPLVLAKPGPSKG